MIIGKLGVTYQEYLNMTPNESYCRLYYLSERERERVVALGNIVRVATTILVNLQVKKDKQIRDPRKLWRFGWEESCESNNDAPEVTAEQLKRISELL